MARLMMSPSRCVRTMTRPKHLIELGYIVIRFHHKDDWLAIFRRHPDVFGAPQT